jgi:hypothetical protein
MSQPLSYTQRLSQRKEKYFKQNEDLIQLICKESDSSVGHQQRWECKFMFKRENKVHGGVFSKKQDAKEDCARLALHWLDEHGFP